VFTTGFDMLNAFLLEPNIPPLKLESISGFLNRKEAEIAKG
jgi:hypothetical protein